MSTYTEMRDFLIYQVLSKSKPFTKAEIKALVLDKNPELFSNPDDNATNRLIEEVLNTEERTPNSPIIVASKRKRGAKAYKLRPARGERPRPRKPQTDVEDSAIIGKAGEFSVMAECLAAGYNASLMAVDKGIDIVASKDNIFYYIQVKTSYLDASGRFSVHIPTQNFNRVQSFGNVVYIAVMRDWVGSFKFFIFREHDIEVLIRNGSVEDTGSNIIIKIAFDGITNEPYLYNGKERAKAVAYLAGTEAGKEFCL